MDNPLTITAEDIERAINKLKQHAAKPPYHIYFIGGVDQGIPNKKDRDFEGTCPNYKRDAPDGGYYG